MRLTTANRHDKSNVEQYAFLLSTRGFQPNVHQRGMTEEINTARTAVANSPGSDCNSNHTSKIVLPADRNSETNASYVSNASSQDVDFIQDNSDYQWFLDYGYRDGSSTTHHSLHQHASVLSSLNASYGCDDLSYYDDIAKNLDANLAEVDMENFRTEDIHSILTTLPAMCCGELQTEREGEMFASVSGSMMAKFDFDSSISPHTSSQVNTMSICKSELLFSPVKECPLPSTNFSIDSLDCDLLTEHDIMLTCQANKDNYTIAFEGSMTLYSEDSDYHETGDSEATTSGSNNWASTRFVRPSSVKGGSHALDTSMARSDSVFTTWSKLKKRSSEVQLTRHPSGNNNTTYSEGTGIPNFQPVDVTALKSQSMPNLSRQQRRCLLTSMSSKLSSAMSSSMESEPRIRISGLGGCVKLFDVQNHHNSNCLLSANSETNSSMDGASICSGGGNSGSNRKQPNFSLVKLFMKQKSVSNEGMCYAMDQSSASECWPASNNSQSEGESDSYNQDSMMQRLFQGNNNMVHGGMQNRDQESVACGCLNDCHCKFHDNGNNTTENVNDIKTTLTHPVIGATNNWIRDDVIATECFEDSLVEPSRKEDSYIHKHHELIEEEDEEEEEEEDEEEEEHESERSESVEQLSESVSKIDESNDLEGNSYISDHQEEQCLNSSQNIKPKFSNSSITKKIMFNVNNNNSIEKEDLHILGRSKGLHQGTQTKKLSSFSSSGGSISNCSSSEDMEHPRSKMCSSPGSITTTKTTATQVPVHLMHRSIQTSEYLDIKMLKTSPFKLLETQNGASLVKILLPNLPDKDKTGDDAKRPVYVFYPNYTLPDLQFLKDKQKELDVTKVILMPQKFSPPQPREPNRTNPSSKDEASRSAPRSGKSRRPFSCSDVEALRKKGFGHIRDWDSLTFLLPQEYRQILAEVPEIVHYMKGKDEVPCPLFCISPPLGKPTRPMSCDCSSLEGKPLHIGCNTGTNVSVSSSTATQPSSGYRGSSTILTDSSSNPNATNCNPLFVYHYDSTSSESTVMMKQKPTAPLIPKRSLSHPEGDSRCSVSGKQEIITPPRPPLPRGILRKSLESTNNKRMNYNCKAHKNNANSKRYSMFELGSELDICKENKRKSMHDADLYGYASNGHFRRGAACGKVVEEVKNRTMSEKDIDELEDEECDDEGVDAGIDSSLDEGLQGYQMRPPTPPLPRTPDEEGAYCQNEVLQLEDLLHMSGFSIGHSGDSLKEWNETDMTKLKQKVSKFLTNKTGNGEEHAVGCDCCGSIKSTGTKKTVSFAAQVQETVTPPNSPSKAVNADSHKTFSCKVNVPLKAMPIREEGESSPEECSSPSSMGSRVTMIPYDSSSELHSPVDLSQKRALVTAVSDAVEQIICHFSAAEGQAHYVALGDSSQTPACAHLALTKLCPALYAVLSDGLRPITKALNDLVLKLNGEDVLTEGLMKFNAFVFGLLNVHSLDAWAGYLRTRESVLRKHYNSEGLILMANTTGASVRALVDQLILTLRPLALLPFKLDLLFEVRQLHHSLRHMSSLLQPEVANPQPPKLSASPSPTGGKPWTLMKLVRSIQNSISQSTDEEGQGAWHSRKPHSEVAMPKTEEATHHPNCTIPTSNSPPLPDLLDSSCNSKQWNGEEKVRPRSCIDQTGQGAGGFSLVTDIASTVKKRWSGIHLGSKLFQAFDRLGMEDTEEEYSDSLENKPRRRHASTSSNTSTSDDYAENISKEESVPPSHLANENIDAQAAKANETASKENVSEKKTSAAIKEEKFKRLQMKWEMLSGKEVNSNDTSPPGNSLSPNQTSDGIPCSIHNSSSNVVRSKIPRLVTSPVRNSELPITSPQPLNTAKRPTSSPSPSSATTSQLKKPSNFNSKVKVSPPGNTKSPEGKLQINKPTNIPTNISSAMKQHPMVATRCSRVDQMHITEQSSGAKGHAARPSSLPYKPSISTQGNKRGQISYRSEPQRRAASTSLNRQRTDSSQTRQRYVRTLCHRLPSESGHLSFNEGEHLRLVLDVDEKWLLCCRGDQKGLVPKQAVIAVQDNLSRF
ncbi:hypothetical protein C0J52_13412 [Blattella germanica]|nr:hypothetical protein C0J52_13412 [Blattella germanica]